MKRKIRSILSIIDRVKRKLEDRNVYNVILLKLERPMNYIQFIKRRRDIVKEIDKRHQISGQDT